MYNIILNILSCEFLVGVGWEMRVVSWVALVVSWDQSQLIPTSFQQAPKRHLAKKENIIYNVLLRKLAIGTVHLKLNFSNSLYLSNKMKFCLRPTKILVQLLPLLQFTL